MNTSVLILVIIAFTALAIILLMNKTKIEVAAPNTLVKHRNKRTANTPNMPIPDVSSAHAHEKKLEIADELHVPKAFFDFSLILDISAEKRHQILSEIQNIRKPHPLLGSLIGSVADSKALLELVRTDPELIAKIINVANSPLFGLTQPITTVNHAISYLGIIQVKNIATHFALQKSMRFENENQQKVYQKIWLASFLASDIVLILAKELQKANAAELSTRCQLSYLGDISILFTSPETADIYSADNDFLKRLDCVQQTTGTNSAIVGSMLADKWNLPEAISVGIDNGLLAFTRQFDKTDLALEDIQDNLLCYCGRRLAEIAIFEALPEILNAKSFAFQDTGKLDFYHMESLLEEAHFSALSYTFSKPEIKARLKHALEVSLDKLQ